jgi:DNA-directed RNA polymerase subunit RPC12/RpoP
MKCLYCTTDLPVDGNTKQVTCPKCGSKFSVRIQCVNRVELYLVDCDPPSYRENERYDSPTNY